MGWLPPVLGKAHPFHTAFPIPEMRFLAWVSWQGKGAAVNVTQALSQTLHMAAACPLIFILLLQV